MKKEKRNFSTIFYAFFIEDFFVHLTLDPYTKLGSGSSNSANADPKRIWIQNPARKDEKDKKPVSHLCTSKIGNVVVWTFWKD